MRRLRALAAMAAVAGGAQEGQTFDTCQIKMQMNGEETKISWSTRDSRESVVALANRISEPLIGNDTVGSGCTGGGACVRDRVREAIVRQHLGCLRLHDLHAKRCGPFGGTASPSRATVGHARAASIAMAAAPHAWQCAAGGVACVPMHRHLACEAPLGALAEWRAHVCVGWRLAANVEGALRRRVLQHRSACASESVSVRLSESGRESAGS